MPRLTQTLELDADELTQRLRPRDDLLVKETAPTPAVLDHAPSGTCTFDVAEGPFERYERTVEWTSQPGGTSEVTESFRWKTAIPYWGALYRPLATRALRNGIAPGRRPWWSTPDRLTARQSTLVAAMALHSMVGGALFAMLTQVLTYASEDLGNGSSQQQGDVFAVVRLGVVVTVVVTALADRVGRRRIAVWAFATAALLTVASALVPSLAALTVLQLVARNLLIAGLLCVDTIVIEELPAGSRAIASGLGAMAYGLGAGLVIMCLPLAGIAVWGWRLVFLAGGLTIPLLWHARRYVPESGRFTELAEQRRQRPESAAPRSGRVRPGRFVLVGTLFLLVNVFVAPTSQLQNQYMREVRGMSATLIAVLLIVTSTPGVIGIVLGGRWADTRGRRAAIVPGLIGVGVFNAIFFSVSGPPMWVASLLGSVIGALCIPAMGVIGSELFPTGRRGAVRGALSAVGVGGSVLGLLVAGRLADSRGFGWTFTVLAIAPVTAGLLALLLPESRGKELEELNE
ncbi:MAG: MFS transporter [Actinomycetes bacterium]